MRIKHVLWICLHAYTFTIQRSSGHLFPLLKKSVSPEFTNTSPPCGSSFSRTTSGASVFSLASQSPAALRPPATFFPSRSITHTPSYTVSRTADMSSPSYSFSHWYMYSAHTPHSSYLQSCLWEGSLASEMLTTLCRMSFTVLMYYNCYLRLQNVKFYGRFSYIEKRIYNLEVMNICSPCFGKWTSEKSSYPL